eukprot:4487480-Karenia_brevis.AAC.1
MWQQRFQNTSVGALQNAVRSWRRWHSWRSGIGVFNPSAVEVARYAWHLSTGKPTAAMVQFRALQFIAISCKLELHVSSDLVAPLRVTRSGHVVRSKAAMRISFLVHWETLVAHKNPHVRAIAMGNLILALAVVRLAHIQRSQLVSVSPSALLFWCRQGKATIG